MKNLALLTYTFLFDPTATFQHLYEFEKSLSDFFAAHGMEAEVIKTVEGGGGNRMLLITRIQEIVPPVANPVGRPKSPGSQFKDLSAVKLRAPALAFKQRK